jgi:colanic acid biosynthesis glycosyl transferase WcaI
MSEVAAALTADISRPAPRTVTGALAGKSIVVYGMNYAPEIAGVGRYTGDIAEHFASEGADVTVITTPPHYPGWTVRGGYRNWFGRSVERSVRVLRCPLVLRRRMHGLWRVLAPATFALSSAPVAIWSILTRRPDVVFLVEPTLFGAPAVYLASAIVGARTVLHVQDLEVDAAFAVGHLADRPLIRRLGSMFERFCLKRADQVVTISHRMAERLEAKGVPEHRLSIVRNWVDLDHIRPILGPSPYRAELRFGSDDRVVLYSGNIGAKQGLHVLVEAARRLTAHPRIKFIIAGDGPARGELMAQASALPNVRFMDFQPADRLNDFLALADIHVLTQDAGAADLVLPSKLGGMLASGKRIVVTAEEGTELGAFVKSAAVVVPPGDAEALATAIVELASQPDVHNRQAAAGALAAQLGKRENLRELVNATLGLTRSVAEEGLVDA